LTKILIISLAVLIGLIVFSWVDHEQPDDLEDTDDNEARRYLASKDGDDD
jgi:nitrogen fixation-related uncharacterized protein